MILDMELRGISGIEVARTLQKERSRVAILALSAHDDREYVQELLKLGAAGYLNKDDVPEFILAAVRGVARASKAGLAGILSLNSQAGKMKHRLTGVLIYLHASLKSLNS